MDISNIKSQLKEKGYCIIPKVLNEVEITNCMLSFKEWKNNIPNHDSVYESLNYNGIYKYHNVGHTWHSWFVRTHPNVQNVFKGLWNTDELIVSFDGCCYIPKTCIKKDVCWAHTDQAPNTKEFSCYQSFVSFTENKEKTFVVYEGTHLSHKSYFEERNINSEKNWHMIDDNFMKGIQDKKRILHVPAGALVIWDSRTFHENQYGDVNENKNKEQRLVQYVCFFSKKDKRNTEYSQALRRKCFEKRRTTTHLPVISVIIPLQPPNIFIDYKSLQHQDISEFDDEIQKLL